ncbi:cupin domain-containing protein [Pseudoalteromonas rubra]|uniref:Cupin domain-containing protein n=1 Tax=Pseudoalteromonas rubra TaxID=43658 RepID=A0A5S3X5T1_9GAMM|nr:cupin domain-containing protein [Pseudoalteromonas rubra]TMP39839.1 cupin domain-containing protein [Pseudoalteromonas rubra]
MTPISKDNAEHYLWGAQCDGWHLVKSTALSVIQERVPPGGAERRHYHSRAEQFFFVLSGVATLEVDGAVHTLQSHQGLYVPAGIAHQLSNTHHEDLIFIVTSTPPSHGDRVELGATHN